MIRARAVWIVFGLGLTASGSRAQSALEISADALRARLVAFAHDSMQGRMTGTRAGAKAAEYIAAELKRMGAKPAGDNNTFFQKVPIRRVTIDIDDSEMLVDGLQLKPGIDFLPIAGHFGMPFPVQETSQRPLGVDFRGSLSDIVPPDSLALLKVDTLTVTRPAFIFQPPRRSDRMPDYQLWNAAPMVEQYRGHGVAFVATIDLTPRSVLASLLAPAMVLEVDHDLKTPEKPLPPIPPVVAITRSTATLIASTPPLRPLHYTFKSSTSSLQAPTRNVVAMIEGSDRTFGAEIVVVSAHADHLGVAPAALRQGTDSIMNGADAGGSGSVALLEIMKQMLASGVRPKRTVVFLWTVGGEQGGLGARWFITHTTAWLGTVVAHIKIDAIGRATDDVQLLAAGRISKDYDQWITDAASAARSGLRLTIADGDRADPAWCQGEHWTFMRMGIPSVVVTTGTHADTREVTDSPDKIDYAKMATISQLVAALALDISGRPRPSVDDPAKAKYAVCAA